MLTISQLRRAGVPLATQVKLRLYLNLLRGYSNLLREYLDLPPGDAREQFERGTLLSLVGRLSALADTCGRAVCEVNERSVVWYGWESYVVTGFTLRVRAEAPDVDDSVWQLWTECRPVYAPSFTPSANARSLMMDALRLRRDGRSLIPEHVLDIVELDGRVPPVQAVSPNPFATVRDQAKLRERSGELHDLVNSLYSRAVGAG
jgi:hypothetical protein